MSQQKVNKKNHQKKAVIALFLVLVLTLSPCASLWRGSVTARADTFKIEMLHPDSLIRDGNFMFFGSRMKAELFYWIKSDKSPLFCIQKKANLIAGLMSDEVGEEFDSSSYLSAEKYELVSLVLQCCGMLRGESSILEPGVYLAGQSAVWGITSSYWTDTQKLRSEMEKVYEHIEEWNGTPAEEILSQAQETTEKICQAIEAYYGDESPYIPAFASKYEAKAPVWKAARLEDGSCEAVFKLEDRAEAVKEFVFELPDGWTYEWQGDWIIFHGEQAEDGLISVSGKAKPGSELDSAMPIGLMYIVGSVNYPYFQRLASEVELKTGWSCYFRLLVSSEEDAGNWYLPKVQYYRHQETFRTLYGVELEKTDGDTHKAIAGVEFQPLEYFDAGQLEETVLDKTQVECWNGWKARCSPVETDEEGKLSHWDTREYHYERTYCSGHLEPVITYEGSSPYRREQLEKEAEAAWEKDVKECETLCDFHTVDGSGAEQLREERDLAWEQFSHLQYGYTFKETKPAEGYLPHGQQEKDREIERVYLLPVQAGGTAQKETDGIGRSVRRIRRAQVSKSSQASGSDAEKENSDDRENDDGTGVPDDGKKDVGTGVPDDGKKKVRKTEADRNTASRSDAQKERRTPGRRVRKEVPVWLTSLVETMEPQEGDTSLFYVFSVKNYKPEEPPEETTPEETTPEETTPEETTPEETPPEETSPEETPPEETPPEETTPEETPPEETSPEETPPEETVPKETPPPETPPESTPGQTPPNTPPESSSPPPPPQKPRRSRDRDRPELPSPEETTEMYLMTEEMVPQAGSRLGWIQAEYHPSLPRQEIQDEETAKARAYLPKTGDTGVGMVVVFLAVSGSGVILLFLLRQKHRGRKKNLRLHGWLFGVLMLLVFAGDVQAAEPQIIREEQAAESQVIQGKQAAEPQIIQGEQEEFEEWFTDEDGTRYHLEFCRPAEQYLEEKDEWVSEQVYYKEVEAESLIPEQIFFPSKEDGTGREGSGQLNREEVVAEHSYWSDDFQINLTFYDYDADSFQIHEMEVPKDNALNYLIDHQGRFLELIGCSPVRYQIERISWSGECYDTQGMVCRDARAYGKRLVSDMEVEYSGTVHYPEQVLYLWEAVYRPETDDPVPEVRPVPESETAAAVHEEEQTQSSDIVPEMKKSLWSRLRIWAAYSVSIVVLLPALLYIFLLLYRKRGKKRKKGVEFFS